MKYSPKYKYYDAQLLGFSDAQKKFGQLMSPHGDDFNEDELLPNATDLSIFVSDKDQASLLIKPISQMDDKLLKPD